MNVVNPSEYWFRYLVLDRRMSNRDARSLIEMHGYCDVGLDDAWASSIRESAEANRPRRTEHEAYRRWLRGNRLVSAGRGYSEFVNARRLVSSPGAREAAEVLLIAGVSDLEAAVAMKAVKVGTYSDKDIAAFRHYFWSVDKMLQVRVFEYLDKYSHRSHRYALKSSMGRGIQFATWRIGGSTNRSQESINELLIQTAAARFEELSVDYNNAKTALAAKMWSEIIDRAMSRKSLTTNDVQETLQKLHSLELQFGRRTVSSLETLQNGAKDETA